MIRVIDLLNEPGIDSRVIKSALVQLSVMTEDILLHDLFIKHSGLDIVTSYLISNDVRIYLFEYFNFSAPVSIFFNRN